MHFSINNSIEKIFNSTIDKVQIKLFIKKSSSYVRWGMRNMTNEILIKHDIDLHKYLKTITLDKEDVDAIRIASSEYPTVKLYVL